MATPEPKSAETCDNQAATQWTSDYHKDTNQLTLNYLENSGERAGGNLFASNFV